jgi:hypothetical protein
MDNSNPNTPAGDPTTALQAEQKQAADTGSNTDPEPVHSESEAEQEFDRAITADFSKP